MTMPRVASRRVGATGGGHSTRSVAAVPEVDGVVDAGRVGVLGEDEVGVLGGELDADDRLEVRPRVEVPADVEPLALPALALPEPLHRARVVARQGPPEPLPERRPGRVVVDDECRATRSEDALELGE